MSDICRRGRPAASLPANTKVVLVTSDSMPLNYSHIWTPPPVTNVFELDLSANEFVASDGGAVCAADPGWYAWAPDGISRSSIMPHVFKQLVDDGIAQNILAVYAGQGNTDTHEWSPAAGTYSVRLGQIIAQVKALGLDIHAWVHDIGRWDLERNRPLDMIQAHTNWLFRVHHPTIPNARIIMPKNTFVGWDQDATKRAAVWNALYLACMDESTASGGRCCAGPDLDVMSKTPGSYIWDGIHHANNALGDILYNHRYTSVFSGI